MIGDKIDLMFIEFKKASTPTAENLIGKVFLDASLLYKSLGTKTLI